MVANPLSDHISNSASFLGLTGMSLDHAALSAVITVSTVLRTRYRVLSLSIAFGNNGNGGK